MKLEEMKTTNDLLEKIPEKYKRKFIECLEELEWAKNEKTIWNTEYQDMKYWLSRAAEEMWSKLKDEKIYPIYRKKIDENRYSYQTDEDMKTYDEINFFGINCAIASMKKLEKSKSTGPFKKAIEEFMLEMFPIAVDLKDIKQYVKKGRKPSENPKKAEINPNKIVKTCPCCIRSIAVTPKGKMDLHGYQRPGNGYQTQSCDGIRFRPLEESLEGLDWTIENLKNRKEETEKEIKYLNNTEKLMYTRKNLGQQMEVLTVTKSDKNFETVKDNLLRDAQFRLDQTKTDMKWKTNFRKEWIKKHPELDEEVENENNETTLRP